jgi:hypothetical protein
MYVKAPDLTWLFTLVMLTVAADEAKMKMARDIIMTGITAFMLHSPTFPRGVT